MKNQILFLLLILFLSSCSTVPFDVENPYKSTTVEIQELVETDTTCYRIVFVDGNLYVIDNSTKLVKYKAKNENHYDLQLLAVFILTILLTLLIIIIITDIYTKG